MADPTKEEVEAAIARRELVISRLRNMGKTYGDVGMGLSNELAHLEKIIAAARVREKLGLPIE